MGFRGSHYRKRNNNKRRNIIPSRSNNPTQFNNSTDLEKYPRKTKEDTIALENHQCDALFMPDVEEVYGHKKAVEINLGSITEELEGKLRPGHFNGVALVVSKLFNIILVLILRY